MVKVHKAGELKHTYTPAWRREPLVRRTTTIIVDDQSATF